MESLPGATIAVFTAGDLSGAFRAAMHGLFDETYDRADHGYLDKSLDLLCFAAVAVAGAATVAGAGQEVIGFALGETRGLDLPGLPGQRVALAGLCCVDRAFRRRGLFRLLEKHVLTQGSGPRESDGPPESEDPPESGGRLLTAGRMAHPASMGIMRGNVSALPRPGFVPTAFQREVARRVADCYGVEDFDPDTFVCHGRGRPIGYPRVGISATAADWELFAGVDRDRGDSLLALSWIPDAPPAW